MTDVPIFISSVQGYGLGKDCAALDRQLHFTPV